MSLQVKFPFGRGHGPLHTCGTCGFMTRHRAMYDRHLQRCGGPNSLPATSDQSSSSPEPPLPSPPVCRNYRCEKCGYATSRSKVYLHHRRETHGENFSIYPCDLCEYASRHKSKVIRHRGLVHKDAPEDPDFPHEVDTVSESGLTGDGSEPGTDVGLIAYPEMREVGSAVYQASYETLDMEEEEEQVPDENQNTPSKKRPAYTESSDAEVERSFNFTFSSPEDVEKSPNATHIPDPTENPYDYIASKLDEMCAVSYKCRLCAYSNIHKWKVATHVRSVHMRKTLFKCPLCEFVTERKIEWCVHKTTHTEKMVHACKECSYRTTMKRNFERHQAHHRVQGTFKCNKCSYSTSGEAAVQRHMAEYHPSPDKQLAMDTIHVRVAPTSRTLTSAPSNPRPSSSQLVARRRTNNMPKHTGPLTGNEVQCNMCFVWFKNETRLRIHMVSHSSEAPHGCPVCNLRYKRPADLNRHMKRKHGTKIEDGKPGTSPPEQDQPLDLCVKRSDEEDEQDSSDGEQPLDLSMKPPADVNMWKPHEIKCSYCSYMAKWPSDLRRHMLVHSIEKRFRCPHCNKKYKYQFDLNMHMRKAHRILSGKTRVSSAAAFSVNPASKVTVKQEVPDPETKPIRQLSRVQMKESKHLISTYFSTSGVPENLKCPYCEYVGKYSAEVERHAQLHYGSKPYSCLFCTYRTLWKGDIKQHLIKQHNTEVEKYGELPELVNLCFKPEDGREDNEELLAEDTEEEANESNENESRGTSTADKFEDMDTDGCALDKERESDAVCDMSEYMVDAADKKLYQCPKCNLVYDFPSKLKNHLEVHDNIKKFLCPHCGKRSNWQWDIRKHIINQHPDLSIDVLVLSESEARATVGEYMKTRQPSPAKVIPGKADSESKALEELQSVQGLDDYARVMNLDSIEQDDPEEDEPPAKKPHSLLDSIPGGVSSLNLTGSSVSTLIATVAAGRYRKFKCSKCGKRSNWKWDIKKHIRVNHPLANVIELSEREAKETFHEILATAKPKDDEASLSYSPSRMEVFRPSPAGRKPGPLSAARSKYRPFKCTWCGKRSNWKWDLKKHLMKCDRKAEMITLSEEEAKATFDDECKIVPNHSRRSTSVSPTKTNPEESPAESTSPKVKKFKCSICPYRSDYRSDISRHLKRKHRKIHGKILVLGTDYAASTLTEYKQTWVKKKFVISPEKVSELQLLRGTNDIPELDQCVRVVDVDPDSDDDDINDESEKDSKEIFSSPERNGYTTSPAMTPSSVDLNTCHNKLWQCTKCEFQCRNKMTVIDHFRSHRQGRPFQCNVCGYTSDYRGSIYRHVKQKHKRKDYQDVITYVALKEVPTDSKHNTPRVTLSPKENDGTNEVRYLVKTFKCQLCPSKTIHKHNLIRHIKEKHPEIENPHQSYDEVMAYSGKPPNASLASRAKQNAVVRGDGVRMLRCSLCPFQTIKSGLLKIHEQYHKPKGGDYLRCKYCPYFVCTMQRLLKHMQLHVKDQNSTDVFDFEDEPQDSSLATPSQSPYKSPGKARHFCDKCPYISINKNDFIYHKQFHRPKPTAPYKCDFCPYWVSLRRLLTQHQKVHSIEYKIQYYPKEMLLNEDMQEIMKSSSAKSEQSSFSIDSNDIVEIAHLKQQIISSKVTSVPISPQKLKTPNLMDCMDDNLMKGYVVDGAGQIVGNKTYRKLHQCRFCPYQNTRSTNLRLHERMHGRGSGDHKQLFRCQYCDYQVGNRGLLAHHTIVHSSQYQPGINEINDVEPMDENGEFLVKKTSSDGEEDEDEKNNNVAPHVFPERVALNTDPCGHLDVNQLPGKSDFYIKIGDEYDGPVLEKASMRKWGCDRCPYATMRKSQFEKHLMLHGCKQRYQCEFCDYSVPGYNFLVQHKKLHLMPNPNLLSTQSISSLQRLPEIPADYAAAADHLNKGDKYGVHDSLPMYENSHEFMEPKKLYRCDRCPYTNVRRDHLLSHLKFHMINSDLRCPYCDYSVSKVHLLNQHVKVHFSTPGTEMSSEPKDDEPEEPDFFTALKLRQKVKTDEVIAVGSIENDARSEAMEAETGRTHSEGKDAAMDADDQPDLSDTGKQHIHMIVSPTRDDGHISGQDQAVFMVTASPRAINNAPSPSPVKMAHSPKATTMPHSSESINMAHSPKAITMAHSPEANTMSHSSESIKMAHSPKSIAMNQTNQPVRSPGPVTLTATDIPTSDALMIDTDEIATHSAEERSWPSMSVAPTDGTEEVLANPIQDDSEAQDLSCKRVEVSPRVAERHNPSSNIRKAEGHSFGGEHPARPLGVPRKRSKMAEFRCRYCDRTFPSMHKMLLHEEQHLLGNRY